MKTKLLAMHALGIAHKDIKPQNMMKYKDSYVFIDFGISQYMENGPEALHSTYYEGTPVYMSR
jgi:serine/threonine protein kinase